MDLRTLHRGKSSLSKTLDDLPEELRVLLEDELVERVQQRSKLELAPVSSFDVLYHMVLHNESPTRVVDVLTWSIAQDVPVQLHIQRGTFVALAGALGILPYSWAFEAGGLFEGEGLIWPSSQIVALCLHLSTDVTQGWDRLADQGFMEALLACHCVEKKKNILQYRVRVDGVKGIEVEVTVELNDAAALPYSQANEHGLLLREAKAHGVTSTRDYGFDVHLCQKYRVSAKRLMVCAGLAEWAGLEDHRRFVAMGLLDHPFILATTNDDPVGMPGCYRENIPVG